MPKTPKLDPQDEIQQIKATIAKQGAKIAALEKTKKRLNLIPKPEALDNHEEYLRKCRMVKCYVQEHLSVFHSISEQETGRVARLIALVQQKMPYFQRFEKGWPIHAMARMYLSNEQTRRRADEKAEQNSLEGESDADDEEVALPVKAKTKTKNTVSFAESEDSDDEAGEKQKTPNTRATSDDSDLARLLKPAKVDGKPPKAKAAPKKSPAKSKSKSTRMEESIRIRSLRAR
ncbi:hypothetical protein B0H13DRAFT_1860262 [Mycena leptocephala]|nr:hypothetical protein B0H13DRAFT_1860262 [Mycena leptocephala]